MNRSKLFSALAVASFLTTAVAAQGAKPAPKSVKPVAAMAVTDTTKKKPMPMPKHKGKKPKPVKPDTTKMKKPN